jgi:hypothetical protein
VLIGYSMGTRHAGRESIAKKDLYGNNTQSIGYLLMSEASQCGALLCPTTRKPEQFFTVNWKPRN